MSSMPGDTRKITHTEMFVTCWGCSSRTVKCHNILLRYLSLYLLNLKIQICLIYVAHLKAGGVDKSLFKEGS